jgi:hypothetical protein
MMILIVIMTNQVITELTHQAVLDLYTRGGQDPPLTVQILDIKHIRSRHRLIISDGEARKCFLCHQVFSKLIYSYHR